MRDHIWPGNVRELRNVIERALISSTHGRLNLPAALPMPVAQPGNDGPDPNTAQADRILTADEMRELERNNIIRALEASEWKVSGAEGAAERLGIRPSTLSSRIKALGIERA